MHLFLTPPTVFPSWVVITGFLPSVTGAVSVLVGFFLVYAFILSIYRLYFHPLAKFPGPTLSIISYWYEFYFEVFKRPQGQFIFEIERLHKHYGPIIRINPNELHIRDAEFFNTLYTKTGSEARNKYHRHQQGNGSPGAIISTAPSELHRIRKGLLNRYFSKASIRRLEPLIQEKVDLLCHGLSGFAKRNEIVNFNTAYFALTIDIITNYAYGKSWNCLESPDFSPEWEHSIKSVTETTPLGKQLTWLNSFMHWLPTAARKRLLPDVDMLIATKRKIGNLIEDIRQSLKDSESSEKNTESQEAETMFHSILTSSLPPIEKSMRRIIDEAFVMLIVGTDTTVYTLAAATYHILANKHVLTTLRRELLAAIPEPCNAPSWKILEQLPYLRAVINESLRISAISTLRISTVAPHTPTKYKDWAIPSGQPISMNLRYILLDPSIFPSPHTFKPERWLGKSDGEELEKYLVPFSKGSRACLGSHLAHAEIYMVLANVFRRFELSLEDTVRERDVDAVRDCMVGLPSKESRGVKARILKEY